MLCEHPPKTPALGKTPTVKGRAQEEHTNVLERANPDLCQGARRANEGSPQGAGGGRASWPEGRLIVRVLVCSIVSLLFFLGGDSTFRVHIAVCVSSGWLCGFVCVLPWSLHVSGLNMLPASSQQNIESIPLFFFFQSFLAVAMPVSRIHVPSQLVRCSLILVWSG